MRILDFIDKKCIVPELKAEDKWSVFEELAQIIANKRKDLRAADIVRVLSEREKLGSTGIGSGVAIPHGKMKGLDRLIICVARSNRGIDFEAMDKQPVHLIFLILAPDNAASLYLKLLARLSRLLKDPLFRQRLLGARDAEEILSVIKEADSEF
ncbi:PTS sugar transporter subunit IIA [Thermosulfuriphilus sp.]